MFIGFKIDIPTQQQGFAFQSLTDYQRWALLAAVVRTQTHQVSLQQALHECGADFLLSPNDSSMVRAVLASTLSPEEASSVCLLFLQSLQRTAIPTQ